MQHDMILTTAPLSSTMTPLPPITTTNLAPLPPTATVIPPTVTAPPLPPTTTIIPTVITTHLPTDNRGGGPALPSLSGANVLTFPDLMTKLKPDRHFTTKTVPKLMTSTTTMPTRQIEIGSLSLSLLCPNSSVATNSNNVSVAINSNHVSVANVPSKPALLEIATTPVPPTALQTLPIPQLQHLREQPPRVIKNLIEPLPESALRGLIKVEPDSHILAAAAAHPVQAAAAAPTAIHSSVAFNGSSGSFSVKLESGDMMAAAATAEQLLSDDVTGNSMPTSSCHPVSPIRQHAPLQQSVASPSSSSCASASGKGGGGGKAAKRKRKNGRASSPMTSSTTTTIMRIKPTTLNLANLSNEEEDLSNIQSLETRIQIISHRLGIPFDIPIEVINGGHGIKNPMSGGGDGGEERGGMTKVTPPPIRLESDPSKLQCGMCTKTFTLQRLLNRHMKCHSDTKRYLCTFCAKGFNDTFDLKRHTRTHTGVRPYKCNLCEKSFTQRCSLESHCLKVHGVAHQYDYKERRSKMYVCEDCGHTTAEPEVHYIHLKDNHPHSQ